MNKRLGMVLVLLAVTLAAPLVATAAGVGKMGQGGVEGVFLLPDGKTLSHGIISFFKQGDGPPPEVSDLRRVPDLVTRTDGEGKFKAQLPAGGYYIGALVREVGKGPGPPRPGEKYYFALLEKEKFRVVEVKAGGMLNAGTVQGQVPTKSAALKKAMTLSGVVRHEDGKPFANAWVTVKKNLEAPRPLYISVKTGEDGRYEMKVPPGRYYVMVRDSLEGRRPLPGTFMGIYGKKESFSPSAPFNISGKVGDKPPGGGPKKNQAEAVAVEGKDGQVRSGIDVTMYQIPVPEEMRKKFETEAQGDKGSESGK